MCRNNENGRLILSRAYKYASANRFVGITKDKNNNRELTLVFTNNGGEAKFELIDLEEETKETLENPISGEYKFFVKKEHKYRFTITLRKAIGSYSLRIKPIL